MLAYILSSKRSGSTLLEGLLGNNEQIASVGELGYFSSHLLRQGVGHSWGWNCTCGEEIEFCPFWSKVLDGLEGYGNLQAALLSGEAKTSIRGFNRRLKPINNFRPGYACWALIRSIKNSTGARVVCDSSKTAAQLEEMMETMPNDEQMAIIILTRDGRATLFSKATRTGRPFFVNAAALLKHLYLVSRIVKKYPSSRYFVIRYEALCEGTENIMSELYGFLGVDERLNINQSRERHSIAGSPSRFDNIRGRAIKKDDRWRKGMPKWQLIVYALLIDPVERFLLNKIARLVPRHD